METILFSFKTAIKQYKDIDLKEVSLNKLKNGNFKGVFDLNKDASYEFKYVVDGQFVNEPEADSFRWNDYAGAENSVLSI